MNKKIKIPLYVFGGLALLALLFVGWVAWRVHTEESSGPKVAKSFTANELGGNEKAVLLEGNSAQPPTVLHVWGPWCGPCVKEFPSLVAFADRYPDIRVVAVSVWSPEEDVRSYFKRIGFEPEERSHRFINLLGKEGTREFANDYYEVHSYPTTFLISRDGRIVKRVSGTVDWESKKADKAVDALRKGQTTLSLPRLWF